ncbi:MAG: 1,4-dihydroxy-2-naphthoate octaprenyltransferase [Verrucomicrobia bacterium ADurb.Bin345]|nr:MAG: 1,4-dihydroxy-2-naphthoate octaprenyltransferase [Verrucomicrobia bacterium ADurb.Bin345]
MNSRRTGEPSADTPGFFRRWLVASRPFSFPASVTPVILGTVLAVTAGGAPFHPIRFLLAVFAIVSIHASANILNDIGDFRRGLDRTVVPGSGAVVRGFMTSREALAGALILLAAGSVTGLILVWLSGPALLWIGVAGVAIGVFYTAPPFGLKYRALGDVAVFSIFGILGTLGAWTVQTGRPSWIPAWWAVPIAMLVAAILHANNWRDIVSDREGRISTIASLLGDRGSLAYYGVLVFGAFGMVLLFIAVTRWPRLGPPMPLTAAIVLLAFPQAMTLWRKARRRHAPEHPTDFVALDGATAQLNMIFGILYAAGLAVAPLLAR